MTLCMHIVMHYYIHVINHESINQCIHIYIHTNIQFHWKEHGHASERKMLSRFHYALPVSTTFLRR